MLSNMKCGLMQATATISVIYRVGVCTPHLSPYTLGVHYACLNEGLASYMGGWPGKKFDKGVTVTVRFPWQPHHWHHWHTLGMLFSLTEVKGLLRC